MLYKGSEHTNDPRAAPDAENSLESLTLPKVQAEFRSDENPIPKRRSRSVPSEDSSKKGNLKHGAAGKPSNILAKELALHLEHAAHQRGEGINSWLAQNNSAREEAQHKSIGERVLDRSYDNVINQLTRFLNSITFVEKEALELYFIVGLSVRDCGRVMAKVKNSKIENLADNIREVCGIFEIATQTEIRDHLELRSPSLPTSLIELRQAAIKSLQDEDGLTPGETNGLCFSQFNDIIHALTLDDGTLRRISLESQRILSKYVEEVKAQGLQLFWIKDPAPLFFTDDGSALGKGVALTRDENVAPEERKLDRYSKQTSRR